MAVLSRTGRLFFPSLEVKPSVVRTSVWKSPLLSNQPLNGGQQFALQPGKGGRFVIQRQVLVDLLAVSSASAKAG